MTTQAFNYFTGIGTRAESFDLSNSGPDIVLAGDGNDYVSSVGGPDLIFGGLGSDVVLAGIGDDTVYGDNSGDESQPGAADLILGGSGRDAIFGGGGNDFLNGENDNDTVDGGAGDDTIWGGPGRDILRGGSGNDVIFAATATSDPANLLSINTTYNGLTDAVTAAAPHGGDGGYIGSDFLGDVLEGGSGDDDLHSGLGADILTGGKGADHFTFENQPGSTTDDITDFSVKQDTIELDNGYFLGIGGEGGLAKSKFHIGAKAHDANDRIIYDAKTGVLYVDYDGDGVGPKLAFTTLDTGLKLTHHDFLVI